MGQRYSCSRPVGIWPRDIYSKLGGGELERAGKKSLSLIAFMAEWLLSCCEVFENLNFTEVSFIFSIHIWWLECKTSQHRVMNTVRTKKRSSGEVLSHYKVEIRRCKLCIVRCSVSVRPEKDCELFSGSFFRLFFGLSSMAKAVVLINIRCTVWFSMIVWLLASTYIISEWQSFAITFVKC